MQLKPMRSGARIKRMPDPLNPHTQRGFRILYTPPEHTFEVHVHNNCICNEVISLRNRVMMAVPLPDASFVHACREVAHRVGTWVGRHVPSEGEWIRNYSGRKLTMYENAVRDLQILPFGNYDRYIKSFIKPEKISDPDRDPRTIQARSPRYNFCLGNYLKPIEHKIYNIKGTRNLRRLLPKARIIAKGLDLRSRAAMLRRKMAAFEEPICLSIDASRFDAHVSQALLSCEHAVYKRCYPGDSFLQKLCDMQLVNHGHTAQGIAYKVPGGRMSGDMNTALGNCLIVVLVVATTMRLHNIPPKKWDMLCDGDDTLIFTSRSNYHAVKEAILGGFTKAGFKIKIEAEVTRVEDIPFCQTRAIPTADGWKMCAIPERTLSRALVSTRHYQHPAGVDKVLAQIGSCELAINMGIPMLQSFALAMLRNAGSATPAPATNYTGRIFKAQREFKAHRGDIRPLPITTEARVAFAEAFGIEPDAQIRFEQHMDRIIF